MAAAFQKAEAGPGQVGGQPPPRNGWEDPVLGPAMPGLRRAIRGCPEPLVLEDAGHFVQEWGDEVAREALASFN